MGPSLPSLTRHFTNSQPETDPSKGLSVTRRGWPSSQEPVGDWGATPRSVWRCFPERPLFQCLAEALRSGGTTRTPLHQPHLPMPCLGWQFSSSTRTLQTQARGRPCGAQRDTTHSHAALCLELLAGKLAASPCAGAHGCRPVGLRSSGHRRTERPSPHI